MSSIKDRLIQFVLRGRDELSPEAKKGSAALEGLRDAAASLNQQLDTTKGERGLVRDIQATQRALDQSKRTLAQTEGSVKELREALNANPQGAGLQQSLRDAEREASRLRRQVTNLSDTLGEHEKAAKAAGIDTAHLADEERRLAKEIETAKQAVAATTQELRDLERQEGKASRASAEHRSRVDAAREAMGRGVRQVAAYAAAYVSFSAAAGLVQRGLNYVAVGIREMLATGDKFELLGTRMASLMGSVEGGEKATAWIKQFARDTPLGVEGVTEAFALLKSYGLDPMNGSLQAIVDKNEQLGGGMERLEGIASALGQAWAKEKLQTEEILQLIERGVPVWSMLEKITGRNVAQLQDLASTGKLGRDAISALIREIGGSATGAAAANMKTLSGLVSQLGDAWQDFLGRIAKAGALDYVKRQLGSLADTIEQMDREGRLDALAEALSSAFQEGAEKAKQLAQRILEIDFRRLSDDSTAWLKDFGSNIDSVVQGLTVIGRPIRTLTNLATAGVSSIGAAFTALLGSSVAVMSFMAKAIPDVFGGEKIVAGLTRAREFLFGMTGTFARQVGQDGRDIANTWRGVGDAAEEHASRTSSAFTNAAKKTKSELAKSGDDFLSFFRSTITSVEQGFAAINFADTVEQLEQVKKGIYEARTAGRLTAEQFEALKKAFDLRSGTVQGAKDATEAINQTSAAVAALRAEQQLLSQEFFAGKKTQKQWEDGHNSANEKIKQLESGVSAARIQIKDYESALAAFNSAKTVAELQAFKKALESAYSQKDLNLDQFQELHNKASESIKNLSKSAAQASAPSLKLAATLNSLADAQKAIVAAKTDVDIDNIRTALRKLYNDGKITAAQYNEEIKKTTDRQAELKAAADTTARSVTQAAEKQTRSQEMYNQALEDGIVTNEELRRISGQRLEDERRASGEAMEQQRKQSSEAKSAAEAYGGFIDGTLGRARTPLAQLSAAALALYDRLRGIKTSDMQLDTNGLDATQKSLSRVTEELERLKGSAQNLNNLELTRWAAQTQVDSLQIQESYLGQKAALQSLTEGYSSGTMSAQAFVSRAKSARQAMSLLDDSDLSSLDSAIAAAEDGMKQLGNSTRSTLESLQDELDGLQGRTEDIERRRFAARRRELEAQQAEAQSKGDSQAIANAGRALGLLRQIEAETAQQRQRDEQEKRAQASAEEAPAQAAAAPATVIRLETAKGQAVDVAVNDKADETRLLSILEEAGLRAL